MWNRKKCQRANHVHTKKILGKIYEGAAAMHRYDKNIAVLLFIFSFVPKKKTKQLTFNNKKTPPHQHPQNKNT